MPKPRSFVSDFSLTIGLMQAFGDLIPLIETGAGSEEKFKTVCPVCAPNTASPVKQLYLCSHDRSHGEFTTKDLAKAKQVGDALVVVDKAAIEAAKVSELPKNQLELDVFARADVDSVTRPDGSSYVFYDDGRGTLYPILLHLLTERPDLVFMGQCLLGKTEKLCKIELGLNGQLVLTQLVWPGDLREFDAVPEVTIKPTLLKMAEQMVETAVTEFTPDTYVKGSRRKLADAVTAAMNGEGAVAFLTTPSTTGEANFEALEAMLLAQLEQKVS